MPKLKTKIFYAIINGTSPNDLNKQKRLHLTDKLSQANMAASSGLRENGLLIFQIFKWMLPQRDLWIACEYSGVQMDASTEGLVAVCEHPGTTI